LSPKGLERAGIPWLGFAAGSSLHVPANLSSELSKLPATSHRTTFLIAEVRRTAHCSCDWLASFLLRLGLRGLVPSAVAVSDLA